MSYIGLTLEEMLADFELTASRWQTFFDANPGAAEVPVDIARSRNIGELVWHIYAAAYRHSERLLGEPVTDLEGANPKRDLAAAWELQRASASKLHQFMNTTSQPALDEVFHFKTRTGSDATASRRKLCVHIFLHAIRHWAQIGTLARQNGFPPDWPQDFLFSSAIH